MSKYTKTFSPLQIGKVTIKNRLIQGPVSVPTVDTTDNLTPDGVAFLLERAKGGFGLVIQTACWADMEVESLGHGFMMTPLANPAIFMSRPACSPSASTATARRSSARSPWAWAATFPA